MKYFKIFIPPCLALIILITPLSAYAADYGDYCSDTISYPAENIPAFNFDLGGFVNLLFYNGYDGKYYFVSSTNRGSGALHFTVLNSNFVCSHAWMWVTVYSLDPTAATPAWTEIIRTSSTNAVNTSICPVSTLSKFKFLYINTNANYITENNTTYVVSNTESAGVIYANFYTTLGEYLGDSNNGSSGGGDSGEGEGSYNDSSFKTLVTELFDHLFEVLLYGDDDSYDSTDIDDSIDWLDGLSEDLEDITVKLNSAPSYISGGFSALTTAQDSINDFFEGVAVAVPILYYGIIGVLNIIIIRKIIGR